MSNESNRCPGQYQRCLKVFPRIIGPLRAIAKEYGYALAEHGSLARDIDLVAVAWIERPYPLEKMIAAMRDVCDEITGFAELKEGDPVKKPHGRLCYVILLGGGIYIDLSVIPPKNRKDDK